MQHVGQRQHGFHPGEVLPALDRADRGTRELPGVFECHSRDLLLGQPLRGTRRAQEVADRLLRGGKLGGRTSRAQIPLGTPSTPPRFTPALMGRRYSFFQAPDSRSPKSYPIVYSQSSVSPPTGLGQIELIAKHQ